jgi:hypothetical protein
VESEEPTAGTGPTDRERGRLGRLRRGWRPALLASLATLVLFELGAALTVETGLVVTSARPRYERQRYFWGDHPEFGVWRRPDAEYQHRSACVDVRYRTNSVGARDVERSQDADAPRVVVLGDSFLAGWGVTEAKRVSNRLEESTGIEHLNFAMPHFGPYQSLLVYRNLAKGFRHDGVLIGIHPASDYVDIDLALSRARPRYEYRYRPYLVGDAAPYARFEWREPGWLRVLRRYSYAFNLASERLSVSRSPASIPRPALRSRDARRAPSWFYDFRETNQTRLEWILGELVREAEGRSVAVVLIPVLEDFRRQRLSGSNPLARRLEALGAATGFHVVDLLSSMSDPGRQRGRYFLPCDDHWNEAGNRVATSRILAELAGFYRDVADAPPTPPSRSS